MPKVQSTQFALAEYPKYTSVALLNPKDAVVKQTMRRYSVILIGEVLSVS